MIGTPCEVPVPRNVNSNAMRAAGLPEGGGEHNFIFRRAFAHNAAHAGIAAHSNSRPGHRSHAGARPGYNAISGETGAGKSILIGALNLVLGERADRTLIRAEADQCTVEATSRYRPTRFTAARVSRSTASPARQSTAPQAHVHGRRQQSSVRQRQQPRWPCSSGLANGWWICTARTIISRCCTRAPARHSRRLWRIAATARRFTALLQRRTEIEQAKADLVVDEATYAQQLDLLRFQVKEITDAALNPAEEETLEADYQRSSNAAHVCWSCAKARYSWSVKTKVPLDRSGDLGRVLADLQQVDDSAASLVELHEEARANLQELRALTGYAERVDIDPAQLASLEERVNLAQSLKRKYGGSIEAVNAFGAEAAQKLATLESRDEELARLNAELNVLESNPCRPAKSSAQRQKLIPKLTKAVTAHLNDLVLPRASSMSRSVPPKPPRPRPPDRHGGVSIRAQPRRTACRCAPLPFRRTRPRDVGTQDRAGRRGFHSRSDFR